MASVDGWATAGTADGRRGRRGSLRAAGGPDDGGADGDGEDDGDAGSGEGAGAPSVGPDHRSAEHPYGLDRPALARTEGERLRLARRVLAAGESPGVLVVVQNSIIRDRGRPPGRSGLQVVTGGSHDRHPGLYLAYVSGDRCAFVDRELHMPRSLFGTLALRTVAGLPDGLEYAAPSQLVMRMLTRAVEAGSRADWLVLGPGLAQHWPLRTLTALRGLGLLAELTAEEAEAELAGGQPEVVEGGVVDGHVWAVARRPAQRGDGSRLVIRHRLADPADRTTLLCRGPEPLGLDTVLRLTAARGQASLAFARLRRHSRTVPAQPAVGGTGPAAPPDPWTAWYERVTRAMVAQAEESFPTAGPPGPSGPSDT